MGFRSFMKTFLWFTYATLHGAIRENNYFDDMLSVLSEMAKSGFAYALNLESHTCADKTKAIERMISPNNKKDLRLVGMIGYLAKFIPNLAHENE